MSLTPEQREAAISLMAERWDDLHGPHGMLNVTYAEAWEAMLDALLSEFVVIAKDDVTEDHKIKWGGEDACEPRRVARRLVTRWEPITKEDVGPWTTQETP